MSNAGECPVDHGGKVPAATGGGGKCPVDHGQNSSANKDASTQAFLDSTGITATPPSQQQQEVDKCPVDHGNASSSTATLDSTNSFLDIARAGVMQAAAAIGVVDSTNSNKNEEEFSRKTILRSALPGDDPRNNMPIVAQQDTWPGQRYGLSTNRVQSVIPRTEVASAHQPKATTESTEPLSSHGSGSDASADGETDTWVYPSEQQFFNAMQRKGWGAREEDMKIVVAIHNEVNTQTWNEVLKWESLHPECDLPRLKRFLGRPQDTSPKAYMKLALGYAAPFDRHDWVVDRNGKEVRYIIDFYRGSPRRVEGQQEAIGMHLDVRPALDSFDAAMDRSKMAWYETRSKVMSFFGAGEGK